MKKTLNYPELWQKKRSELPVDGNADAGWAQMRSVLDKQMPVSTVPKKPFRLKLPKWGLHVFVGVSSVVAVYTGYKLYHASKQHDLAVPGTKLSHRDSVAPAAKDTSLAINPVKSSTIVSTADGYAPLPANRTKLNIDTTEKHEQKTIDSIQAPAMLNIPVHRDSVVVPMEITPHKAARDSVTPVNLEKNNIQNDTSKTNGKPKKKRPKVNVFF